MNRKDRIRSSDNAGAITPSKGISGKGNQSTQCTVKYLHCTCPAEPTIPVKHPRLPRTTAPPFRVERGAERSRWQSNHRGASHPKGASAIRSIAGVGERCPCPRLRLGREQSRKPWIDCRRKLGENPTPFARVIVPPLFT